MLCFNKRDGLKTCGYIQRLSNAVRMTSRIASEEKPALILIVGEEKQLGVYICEPSDNDSEGKWPDILEAEDPE